MRVLISGASMAGLSAAHWFCRTGHEVTVVERADGLRRGGAPIDVRGEALCVAARMGILDEIRAKKVPYVDPRPIYDGNGDQVATLDLSWFANEWDDDVEIGRDKLNDILLASVDGSADFRFDTTIETLDDGADAVACSLSDGTSGSWDLVVGADGLHSNVRRLAFGPERDYVLHLGFYVSLLDLPEDDWDLGMLNVPGMAVAVRNVGDGPMAMVIVHSDEIDYDYRDLDSQRDLVVDRFLSRVDTWQVPKIRENFADRTTEGFYFDSVAQIKMPSWTNGRVALIGDAGHCAALLSGMGTSLAMIAAEALASHWTVTGGNLERAAEGFEERVRPYVEKAQASIEHGSSVVVPGTQEQLDERNQMFRDAAAEHAAASA